jgi:peptidoglycan-N-acetylglucosamine deacetylase
MGTERRGFCGALFRLEENIVHKSVRVMGLLLAVSTAALLCHDVAEAAQDPEKGRAYYESRGDVVWEVPGDDKIVALTFDDGPDPHTTPILLDLLKQYGVKATFFAIGNKVRLYPDIARREASEGHELANHTYTHRFLIRTTKERIRKEIADTQQIISQVTGSKCRLFRPPGGMFNDKVVEVSKEEHLQMVMWSWHQDTKDWARPGVARIARKVIHNIHNGDIVLLHDYVSGGSQTVDALKIILPELIKRGYHFVTVSELIGHSKAVW